MKSSPIVINWDKWNHKELLESINKKFDLQIKTLEGNIKYLEETGDLGSIKILRGQISILKYMREELLTN